MNSMDEMYCHLKPVSKVRAIHYEPTKGIFLIKTLKSARANVWTTPGGDLMENEDNLYGLHRIVESEVGANLTRADPLHFYLSSYPCLNEFVTTYAHFVDINTKFTKDKIQGVTQTLLPYRFATLRELTIGSVRTTRTISEMVREGTILERIRAMNRNKQVFA